MEIFLTNEDRVSRRQVGPLNNEEDPLKVLEGAKRHKEKKSHVGSERRTRKSINRSQASSFYSLI